MDFSNLDDLNNVLETLLHNHPNLRTMWAPSTVSRHFQTTAIWDKGICILHTEDKDIVGAKAGKIYLFTDPDAHPIWIRPPNDSWEEEFFRPSEGESILVFSYDISKEIEEIVLFLECSPYYYCKSWLNDKVQDITYKAITRMMKSIPEIRKDLPVDMTPMIDQLIKNWSDI